MPEDVAVPLTVIVAFACVAVGVTVIAAVALATDAEYEEVADANVGLRVPEEIAREDKVATLDMRVTAKV